MFLQVLLATSKVKWQVLKEEYYTLHSNANPSIKLQLLSRQAVPGAEALKAKPCDMLELYSPHFMLRLWMDLWRE